MSASPPPPQIQTPQLLSKPSLTAAMLGTGAAPPAKKKPAGMPGWFEGARKDDMTPRYNPDLIGRTAQPARARTGLSSCVVVFPGEPVAQGQKNAEKKNMFCVAMEDGTLDLVIMKVQAGELRWMQVPLTAMPLLPSKRDMPSNVTDNTFHVRLRKTPDDDVQTVKLAFTAARRLKPVVRPSAKSNGKATSKAAAPVSSSAGNVSSSEEEDSEGDSEGDSDEGDSDEEDSEGDSDEEDSEDSDSDEEESVSGEDIGAISDVSSSEDSKSSVGSFIVTKGHPKYEEDVDSKASSDDEEIVIQRRRRGDKKPVGKRRAKDVEPLHMYGERKPAEGSRSAHARAPTDKKRPKPDARAPADDPAAKKQKKPMVAPTAGTEVVAHAAAPASPNKKKHARAPVVPVAVAPASKKPVAKAVKVATPARAREPAPAQDANGVVPMDTEDVILKAEHGLQATIDAAHAGNRDASTLLESMNRPQQMAGHQWRNVCAFLAAAFHRGYQLVERAPTPRSAPFDPFAL